MWLGKGAQYVPGQSASARLSLIVPEVPAGAQPWEVSAGEVRSLQAVRVVGGTQVIVPEFGLTSAIVFTSDYGESGLLVRLQDQARQTRKLAAQWAHDLAEVEITKVLKVHEELVELGHRIPDGQALLDNARQRLAECKRQWEQGNYQEAYREAERSLRPIRILMRAHWDEAVKTLTAPVSSPYAVSYFTLPKHWRFMEQIERAVPSVNVLADGSFEQPPHQAAPLWTVQEVTLDDVTLQARRDPTMAKEGQQSLMLSIQPKPSTAGKAAIAPAALDRTFLAIHSPAVRLTPGTLVRISAWVHVPAPIHASVDGALFYDSAGGEPLAIRLTRKIDWTKLTLYRRVPESGQINVTMALTGLGTVHFDDVRIEPLLPGNSATPAASAAPAVRPNPTAARPEAPALSTRSHPPPVGGAPAQPVRRVKP
jgi:hypothetical protein